MGLMVAKALQESRDCVIVRDIWDHNVHIREMSDVVTKRLVLAIAYLFKVIFVARLLASSVDIS
jgi:hypothetical protein